MVVILLTRKSCRRNHRESEDKHQKQRCHPLSIAFDTMIHCEILHFRFWAQKTAAKNCGNLTHCFFGRKDSPAKLPEKPA